MQRMAAALLAFGSLSGLGPGLGPGARATPTPGPGDRGLTMDLVLTEVDRALSARPGRFAHPLALSPSARGALTTLAPYFVVPSAPDRGTETLPLEASHAEVHVAGVIAEVRITQDYRNRGREAIEAIYLFPISTRAAVHGLRLRVGGRTVEARVAPRPEAVAAFHRARHRGQRAALLLEERSNLLALRVTHLMPGERVEVELSYSELLVPEDGQYELVLPRVAGPHTAARDVGRIPRWLVPPRLERGQGPLFSLDLRLESPLELRELRSPSHPAAVTRQGPRGAAVRVQEDAWTVKDFVLRYRLAGSGIQAGALTHAQGGEQHFLLLMTPPDRPRPESLPPREVIFVLDVSGSMAGFPLDTARGLLSSLFATLRPVDRFNLVLFAGRTQVLSPRSQPAQASLLAQATGLASRQQGAGETDLLGALRRAYDLPRPDVPGLSRSVVLITDGYVAVQAETFRFVRRRLSEASCFVFGIGPSVDRALIEGLARAGRGTPFVVTRPQEAAAAATRLRRQMAAPVLSGLKLAVKGAQAYDLVPQDLPDLFAGRPLLVFGKLQGGPGLIRVTGHTGAAPFALAVALPPPGTGASTRPLRALWARAWAQELSDQLAMLPDDPGLGKALRRLGVHYHLLTPLTGFVAVDRRVNLTGTVTEVVQPMPPLGSAELPLVSSLQLRTTPPSTGEPDPAPGAAAQRERRSPLAYAQACRRRVGGCGCQGQPSGERAGLGAVLVILLLASWLRVRARRRRGEDHHGTS